MREALDVLAALGSDRVRVTLLWKSVAPSPDSRTRPSGFRATGPESYGPTAWERYDTLVYEARARDRGELQRHRPGALWATTPAPRQDILDTFEPAPASSAPSWPPPPATPVLARQPLLAPEDRVPRVSHWSIWNEPNHSGWLTPQWCAEARSAFPRAATLYRGAARQRLG